MTQANPEILAASLTPLDNNQSIDKRRFADHVQHLLDNGCNGVLLFGTTGEANSFTVFERQAALESLLKSGIPPATLMVGTGCCALPDTLALTRHALEHGVHRAVVLPPFYYKTATDDGLYDTFAALIDQVGDPALRVYLYHFPKMAVVGFSSELIARLVAKFPEQIAGIKDSTGNLVRADGEEEVRDVTVQLESGYLESSNVNAVHELTSILSLARQFELEVRLMQNAKENDEAASRLMQVS